jgi:hypothetical protein
VPFYFKLISPRVSYDSRPSEATDSAREHEKNA